MKLLTQVLVVLGLYYSTAVGLESFPAEPFGLIDGQINSTINGLLANLSDPFEIEDLSATFDSELLTGSFGINDLTLLGVKKIAASKIDVNLLGLALNMTISVPKLILNSKYNADLALADLLPLYGDGRASVTLEGFDIIVGGKLNITGGLGLSNVSILTTLDDANFDLHGMLNNEEFSLLVSEALNDNFVDFLNENEQVIGGYLSAIAQAAINGILGKSAASDTLDEILEVVNRGLYPHVTIARTKAL
ncbi:uncharacterized protein LOC132699566 [Cylas formicarius]|uniref:uncharacterized protein LOC132699566 n=1 Tax=Cylas formicarius TaxID=197179 RepID=UPI002958A740|nr:uncharacterized protein LOC132699566 [Cylas formicarius]